MSRLFQAHTETDVAAGDSLRSSALRSCFKTIAPAWRLLRSRSQPRASAAATDDRASLRSAVVQVSCAYHYRNVCNP
ncbi:hypothetical protein CQ065_25080 [Pseudomonas sp. MYb187]|nr:hypothetical protein CQ065_25080 [Pseudomonas sp. MYb187]